MSHTSSAEIIIRAAEPGDEARLEVVAGRDSSEMPEHPMLVAEVGGDIRAAISLRDGRVVADPFHRTAELVEMLRIRAAGAAPHPAAGALRFQRSRRPRLAFRTAS